MDIAKWLRDALYNRDIPKTALGEHMGWSSADISRKLNGDRALSMDEFMRILEYLGYDLEAFLGATPSRNGLEFRRLADEVAEEQQQALLVYLKLLPKKGS